MSPRARRARRERTGERPGAAKRGRGGAGARTITAAAIALVAIAAIAYVALRGRAPRGGGASDERAAADSVEARVARGDWQALVGTGEADVARRPQDYTLLLSLSAWWQNYGRAQRDEGTRVRSATRTSLDRMACESRALLYADSAAHVAPSPQELAAAIGRRAEVYAGLGLPLDALEAYRDARTQAAGNAEFALRVAAFEAFLADPLHGHRVVVQPGPPRR